MLLLQQKPSLVSSDDPGPFAAKSLPLGNHSQTTSVTLFAAGELPFDPTQNDALQIQTAKRSSMKLGLEEFGFGRYDIYFRFSCRRP